MSHSEPTGGTAGTVDLLRLALSGRYVIERELSRGGMATVYLARDAKHGRAVAVKVVQRGSSIRYGMTHAFVRRCTS